MKKGTWESSLADLRSTDHDHQNKAFEFFQGTKEPVDWAYEVWDAFMGLLKDGDNRQRAIASLGTMWPGQERSQEPDAERSEVQEEVLYAVAKEIVNAECESTPLN